MRTCKTSVGIVRVSLFMRIFAFVNSYTWQSHSSDEFRRDELVRKIEHALQELTLGELEALYYDMISKDYLRD